MLRMSCFGWLISKWIPAEGFTISISLNHTVVSPVQFKVKKINTGVMLFHSEEQIVESRVYIFWKVRQISFIISPYTKNIISVALPLHSCLYLFLLLLCLHWEAPNSQHGFFLAERCTENPVSTSPVLCFLIYRAQFNHVCDHPKLDSMVSSLMFCFAHIIFPTFLLLCKTISPCYLPPFFSFSP